MAEIVVIFLVLAVFVANLLFYISVPDVVPVKMKWDPNSINFLKQEFNSKLFGLHGQDKAIDQLIKLLQKNYNDQEHTLIFLLGGPGVGKEEMCRNMNFANVFWNKECKHGTCKAKTRYLDIPIGSNVKSKFPTGTFCDSLYHKGPIIAFAVDHINNFKQVLYEKNDENFANFYKIDDQCLKELNLNFVHIVTGSIMSNEDLESFNNAEEYDKYVTKMAKKLGNYMTKHAPELEFHIITLKSFNKEQVLKNSWWVNETEFNNQSEEIWKLFQNYSQNNIIPYGTNFFNHVNNIMKLNSSSEWNSMRFNE